MGGMHMGESPGGVVSAVEPRSLAAQMGVCPGDVLLVVNGAVVEDVIDVQYYAAEYAVELTLRRGGKELSLYGERREGQPLGLSFEHPTFDTDIRRCNNLCEFCFVLQMAPRMRRTLYIKDDDYRYSFLFGHYVTLTNLTERDRWRIVEQHLSPLYVSVHATDNDLRRRFLRNSAAPDIMEQLTWLVEGGIEVHTQIVVVPGFNDGTHLARSVRDLARLYPSLRSVSVVPVGLTKHHKYGMRPNTQAEAAVVLDACHTWQAAYRSQFDVNFVYPTDEWYLVTGRPVPLAQDYDGLDLTENGLGMVRRFMDEWNDARAEIGGSAPVKRLTLATGALFGPTLAEHASDFEQRSSVAVDVAPISNTRLGETITVAGLLMGEDLVSQLQGRPLGDVVVLPRIMFDHPDGISLDGRSPLDIARELIRPVALADLMGDLVDIIHGSSALYFNPSDGRSTAPGAIHKDGGWAVEKDL